MANATIASRYPVWDLPTRISHWALVLLVVAQFVSGLLGLIPMSGHLWMGYALLVTVLFRIVWGFVGSDSARFSHFLRGPGAVADYLGELWSSRPTRWPGHNPLGGWSSLALLLLTLAQSVTGLFASQRGGLAGPLAHQVARDTASLLDDLHGLLHWPLLALVLIHVAAGFYYRLRKRENRLSAIFGDGRLGLDTEPALRFAGTGRALWVLFLAVAIVVIIAMQARH